MLADYPVLAIRALLPRRALQAFTILHACVSLIGSIYSSFHSFVLRDSLAFLAVHDTTHLQVKTEQAGKRFDWP